MVLPRTFQGLALETLTPDRAETDASEIRLMIGVAGAPPAALPRVIDMSGRRWAAEGASDALSVHDIAVVVAGGSAH